MRSRGIGNIQAVDVPPRTPVVSDGVLGMMLFLLTELMLFAGMISAFAIAKAGATVWPPPGQPRLPIEATAANSLVLLASGALLIHAQRQFSRDRESARKPFFAALTLGTGFVLFQGFEWVQLIGQGLTLQSSALGSFFYLIVGVHAAHAIAALWMLARTGRRMLSGWLQPSQLATAAVFWYFVVGVWPVVYGVVYW
ncbi:MAG: cytochrome c oxidase subunit 3 [Myxococcota bacterium]|nr:cytochrome c oxidase subunit 3 [Myxococcota bacterium]